MDDNQDRILRELGVVILGKGTATYPADGAGLRTLLAQADAKVTGLVAAVAALSNDQDITVEQMREIVTDAVEQNIQITGNVQIGPAQ